MYPTIDEVNKADRRQICSWYRFLPSPRFGSETETSIIDRIVERYKELGGMTPEISKSLG